MSLFIIIMISVGMTMNYYDFIKHSYHIIWIIINWYELLQKIEKYKELYEKSEQNIETLKAQNKNLS